MSRHERRFGSGLDVVEQDVQDEMRLHLECLVEELEAQGLSSQEARRRARRQFGDADRYLSQCGRIDDRRRRSEGWSAVLDQAASDLRQSARRLARRPGASLTIVATLALAVGLSTAVFSVFHAALLVPVSVPNPLTFVTLEEMERDTGDTRSVSPANFVDWRDQAESLDGLAAFERLGPTLSGEPSRRLRAAAVTEDFFSVVDVPPALGRVFVREDYEADAEDVVVLSHELFVERFGGRQDVLGTTVLLDREPMLVVGVMPPRFALPADRDVWLPLRFDFEISGARGARYLYTAGRLAPGESLQTAAAELDAIARRLEAEYPDSNTNTGIRILPWDAAWNEEMRPVLTTLLGAVSLLVLIACATIAGLILSRASVRRREMELRVALGARTGRLVGLLMGEASLLAFAGGAAGLLLASLALRGLVPWMAESLPRQTEVTLSAPVAGFAFLVAAICTLVFGLIPAMRTASAGSRGRRAMTKGRGEAAARRALVVAEIALALVLLLSCGLLVKSLLQLSSVDLGFDARDVLTFKVDLPSSQYAEERVAPSVESLLDSVRSLPGVQSAAAASWLPLTSGWYFVYDVVGEPELPPDARRGANLRMITPGYFETLGIAVAQGRAVESRDGADTLPVVVINQALARQAFADRDPIGQELLVGYGSPDEEDVPRRIVGVVGDVHHFGPAGPKLPTIYVPHRQIPFSTMDLAVRTDGPPRQLAGAVGEIVRAFDPELALDGLATLEERYADRLRLRRVVPGLLGLFAAVAVLLASLGLYGVLAEQVRSSRRELGVRRALGATGRAIVAMVAGRAALLVLVGLGVGGMLSWASVRLLRGMLFQVGAADPVTVLVVMGLVVGLATVATIVPAREACRVDPARSLAEE